MTAAAILDGAVAKRGGRQAVAKAAAQEAQSPDPFTRISLADLFESPPEARVFWWDGLVPAGAVTLLGAHGDSGKSMLSLMLACSLCAGEPLFGVATKRARVAYFSAEDPADTVRQRLYTIARSMGLDPVQLDESLHVLDATERDPVLFRELAKIDGRPGVTTGVYDALRAYLDALGVNVLIVDNASDVFDASENDRAKVRGFMRALTQLAQPDRAVVLLAHVNRGTASGFGGGSESRAEGYSGSTAWHNSARSRLYLRRDKEGGGLVLEHHKNNLGQRRHEPIHLSWPIGGLPQLDKPVEGIVQNIADTVDIKALLRLVHEFNGRGKFIAASQFSPANAARVLSGERGYPNRKPAQVFALLNEAERRQLIRVEAYRTSDRKERERWALTDKGCALIGAPAPTAPTAPTYEDGAPLQVGAGGAPTAPTCGAGGVGGLARAQQVDSEASDGR